MTKKTDKQPKKRSKGSAPRDRLTPAATVRGSYEFLDKALGMLALCGVGPDGSPGDKGSVPKGIRPLVDVQRDYTLAVLACCGGNKERAAKALGIGRATIFRRISDYRDQGYAVGALASGSTAAKLAHLPDGTRHVINRLVDLITINVDVEHIVLYGRYARPGGVDEGHHGDDSMIELVVLVDHPDLALRSEVWDMVEERAQGLARPTRVCIERRTVAEVAAEIMMGDKALGEALEHGVPLYDSGRVFMELRGGRYAR